MMKRGSITEYLPDAALPQPVDSHTQYEKSAEAVVRRQSIIGDELYDDRYETTKRGLKSRHAQMIAIGGTMGTGLFVSTGLTLATGGPGSILIAFLIIAFSVYCIVTAITEVAAYLPTTGSTMSFYGHRYVSRTMGFAMGWLYFYSLGILVPYEITAAALVIDYWSPPVSIAVWITIMMVIIVGLNMMPVRFYGESEFWFAGIKIIMVSALLILSIVLFFGGGPHQDGVLGFHNWKTDNAAQQMLEAAGGSTLKQTGAFHEMTTHGPTGKFIAFIRTIVLAAFPFTFAPELIVATGGEMQSPRRNLPTASKRYFYRLLIFYIGTVIAIGVIVPAYNPLLTSGGAGAGSSPYVIGIKLAGISGLDSVINAGIIISAWSAGNGFLYLSSRSLYSLAVAGHAPRFFKSCSKNGVPYRAVAVSSLFAPLAYLNVGSSASKVFTWFLSLTNTSAFISWMCCCIVYFRFRKACKAQGVTDLPFRSWLQPWGAYWAFFFFGLICLLNGFAVFLKGKWNVSNFLTAYIGIPIFLVFFAAHRIYAWSDPWARDPMEVDLKTGLKEVEDAELPPPVYNHWYSHFKKIYE